MFKFRLWKTTYLTAHMLSFPPLLTSENIKQFWIMSLPAVWNQPFKKNERKAAPFHESNRTNRNGNRQIAHFHPVTFTASATDGGRPPPAPLPTLWWCTPPMELHCFSLTPLMKVAVEFFKQIRQLRQRVLVRQRAASGETTAMIKRPNVKLKKEKKRKKPSVVTYPAVMGDMETNASF